jgi:sterol desaturase/sphingolipid hydroxylase (fatty acid hydroxylase superfamily)
MRLFAIEHSTAANRFDFAFYGAAVLLLAAALMSATSRQDGLAAMALVLIGLGGWTIIEYGLHRFVLHRLAPFKRWHADHHRRPTALIGAPTVLSATLIAMLVFLPTLALSGPWQACALTLGVTVGYLAYISTHHATHHWRIDNGWIRQRKHWHARHHHSDQPLYYGVTSALWDHVFRTAHPRPLKVDRNFPETPASAGAGRRVISDAALFAPIQQPRGTP